MRITFVLLGWSSRPVGGYKVVYHYANEMANLGHDVVVAHANETSLHQRTDSIRGNLRRCLGSSWCDIDRRVKVKVVRNISNDTIPDGDVVIATAYQTAVPVYSLAKRKGEKYYFIQHYETWAGQEQDVNSTWVLPMRKIVISKWLQDKARDLGTEAYGYVPNPIDTRVFRVTLPPRGRDPLSIAMMWHEFKWKGSADGIAVLSSLKERIPGLVVTLFGVHGRPARLPLWMKYMRNPSQQSLLNIYNQHAVFMSTSHIEGWGLTIAEAMASGACVVSTNSRGLLDFAVDGQNARIVEVGNLVDLERVTYETLMNPQTRVSLAERGVKDIAAFDYDAAQAMLDYLLH